MSFHGKGLEDVADALPVTGDEDAAIPLDVAASVADVDGSESVSAVQLSGIPVGAVVTDGVNSFTASADTSAVNITSWDLDALTITPPEDSSDDFSLTVTAQTIESSNGDLSSVVTETMDVAVTARADAATLDVPDTVTGAEDTAIPLGIDTNLTDIDGSETLTITVAGVPDGATLSAGIDNGDGTWALTSAQAAVVAITPAANSDVDFTLDISATTVEGENGDSSVVRASIDVNVTAGGRSNAGSGDERRADHDRRRAGRGYNGDLPGHHGSLRAEKCGRWRQRFLRNHRSRSEDAKSV